MRIWLLCLSLDKSGYQVNILYIAGTQKHLTKALLMSTYHICFRGEIRKISELLDCKKHLIKSYVSEYPYYLQSQEMTTVWKGYLPVR